MQPTRRTLVTVTTLVVGLAVALAVSPGGAQDPGSGPYGSTTTTTTTPSGSSAEASCTLSATRGEAGDPVTATVAEVTVGTTVRILFDGTEVGRATAPGQGSGRTTVTIAFEIPEVEPGDYLVTAVGADFTATCNVEVNGRIEVLSGSESNAGGDGGVGGGSLPRTGVYAALLVTIAVALLLFGRTLVEASRRRRRRAQRTAWQAGNHLRPPRQRTPK